MKKETKKKIEEIFLKDGAKYSKSQFWVVVTKEPIDITKKKKIEIDKDVTILYLLEDFISMVENEK